MAGQIAAIHGTSGLYGIAGDLSSPFVKGHFLLPPFVKGGQGGFQQDSTTCFDMFPITRKMPED
jgi:hypothetical protein